MRAADLVAFWDAAVADFLVGGPAVPAKLASWRTAYDGRGDGRVDERAFPEPYLGTLVDAQPRAVFLALNPGRAHLDFQAREGVFADEIRQLGSYSAWAATWPYLRDPWVKVKGANRHHQSRFRFMQRWFEDPSLTSEAMVGFELFPWHSTRVTGSMRPDPGVLRELVWEPIADLGRPVVFAFGAVWADLLPRLGVEQVAHLGRGGRNYGSAVPSRSVLLGQTASGSLVVAEKHSGSAGPPSSDEIDRLRWAVEKEWSQDELPGLPRG